MTDNITSEIYDKNIISQGVQFQVDTYYEPRDNTHKRRLKIVLQAVNPQTQEKILDIGCGAGTFAFHCAKLKTLSFGIDYSKASIKTAQELCEMYGVTQNVKFIIANAIRLPFMDSCFDKIVTVDFIEHTSLDEKDMIFGQIRRLLKPEGICVIFTPNKIRERIGEVYCRIKSSLSGNKVHIDKLHFGLTTRFELEAILKKHEFNFRFSYQDITRPYLARIPLLNHFLALNLLWVIRKDES